MHIDASNSSIMAFSNADSLLPSTRPHQGRQAVKDDKAIPRLLKEGNYLTNLNLQIELSFHYRGSNKLLPPGKVQLRIFEREDDGHIGNRYRIVPESVVIGFGPLKRLMGARMSWTPPVPRGIPFKDVKIPGPRRRSIPLSRRSERWKKLNWMTAA
ncbi:hypothetical protein FPQ18DRAFT_393321 [Pyronema domesticum]|nr:hypothetical protein FPQ18DRAFT_393321 [Pyronema domesticum]